MTDKTMMVKGNLAKNERVSVCLRVFPYLVNQYDPLLLLPKTHTHINTHYLISIAIHKPAALDFEEVYLSALPTSTMYEKSYMHRDVVTHTAVASTEFIITASCDGQLKFWKKMPIGVEFVKEYRAHLGKPTCKCLFFLSDHIYSIFMFECVFAFAFAF